MDAIIKSIELIILIMLPGFISNALYNIICQKERILDGRFQYTILVWGALNYALIYPFMEDKHLQDLSATSHYLFVLVLPLIVGIIASILRYQLPYTGSSLAVRVQKYNEYLPKAVVEALSSLQKLGIEHPYPTAWNAAFSQNKCYWVKARLKDRRIVGGYFGDNSYVSAYPNEEQIYLEKMCILDENSDFTERIEHSEGIIIFKSELVALELFTVEPDNEIGDAQCHEKEKV